MKFPNTTVCMHYTSTMGAMTLAANGQALVGIWFDGQRHQPDFSPWAVVTDHPVLRRAAQQLDEYFAGKRLVFDLPVDFSGGTAFQQSVWRALCRIDAKASSSYGSIARELKNPNAVRAVGSAVGRNPLSIVVPCHRVLGSDGSLTGYAGGLERKQALLQLEDNAA